jgi:hypothetical protein
VRAIRRALYLASAAWALIGLSLLLAPGFVLGTVLDQATGSSQALTRLLGLDMVGLAMFMVLVGHRAQDLWWWSWAFALVGLGTSAALVLNAAFGLASGQSGTWWWLGAALAVALTLLLLYGLWAASQEQPLP